MPTLAEQQQLLKDYVRTNNPVPQGITSARLAPRTRVTLPTQNQPVPASGLQPAINSSVQTFRTQSEQDRADREASLTTQKSGLDKSIEDIMGLNTEIGNVENTVDRTSQDTAQKEADRLTSEIEAEQLANRRKIENLQKNNPDGLFGGGLNQEINRIDRESLSKQADLAILQNSALRNYSTAKEIADREVQNKLEPLKIKLENYKFFYQENKADFNKQEERLYSEKIKEQDRAIKKEEDLQNQISSIKLEAARNGAPVSVLNKLSTAKTFDEALALAGNYNMSIADRAKTYELGQLMSSSGKGGLTDKQKTAILNNPTARQATARIGIINAIDEYNKKVQQFKGSGGIFDFNRLTKAEKQELKNALNTTIGSAINVAQGQGAMGEEEGTRILSGLDVSRWKRGSTIDAAARGTIDAQKSLLDNELDFIDSSIPGASDNYEIFKKYKISSLPPEEQARAVKLETVSTLSNAGYDETDIVDYLIAEDPGNAQTIQTLYNEGYTLEEIMQSL